MDVVVVSGHMVDTPQRERPRFPPAQVPFVTREVRAALGRWDVGPDTTLVCGGARGADIIAAEAALDRGASVHLVLAFEPETFKQGSVTLEGSDWAQRFDALLARAGHEVVGGSGDEVYARTNDRILEFARAIDERPYGVVVWDGATGDGPGGTSDFVERLRRVSGEERLVIIDPLTA